MRSSNKDSEIKEFDFISKYLTPLTSGFSGALSLQDDIAILPKNSSTDYIITLDTIIEGTHFLSSATPVQIANKLIRSNLSDIASAGGIPKYYFLTGNVLEEKFLLEFTQELKKLNKKFGIVLAGGDTVKGGDKKFFSATVIGEVRKGKALLRSGAKSDDDIYVSGQIGAGWSGLNQLQNKITGKNFINHYYSPEPRLKLGQALIDIANSCTDISDGLLRDLNNILKTSNKTAQIWSDKIPLAIKDKYFFDQISGGDDYELIFTAAPAKAAKIAQLKLPVTKIGKVTVGNDKAEKITIIGKNNQKIDFKRLGYEH